MTSRVIPCALKPETKLRINRYAETIRARAPSMLEPGLPEEKFWNMGLFGAAIERLRGIQAASTADKREFVEVVLRHLEAAGLISGSRYKGAGERFDFEVRMPSGRVVVIEAKGCLDGNNTNIFERPPQAEEFIIWSLCQNAGADPEHNAWSGIHTRLGAEIIHRQQRVDGLVIWDKLCGTARPCPKLEKNPKIGTQLETGATVPPPCLYLFPRSLPDPRNNPAPKPWRLPEVEFLTALHAAFNGGTSDVTTVEIRAEMDGARLMRKTLLRRDGELIRESGWTELKRSRR